MLMREMTDIRIFLLVVGNALALFLSCLGFQTTSSNLMGWFLFVFGITYMAGGAIFLWAYHHRDVLSQVNARDRSF